MNSARLYMLQKSNMYMNNYYST
ncbi:hypothetical protein CHELA20_50829 [Hyphomicrobiales bacterium]|nr:hypothetical protein CHELA20_50829 [Hyphomicrobiales bacterium]CAH1676000.1 hypothetical protein CHELA41_24188 [Hyphomicrobiales bacterium]